MRRVFADTSFYQALLNRKDDWHGAAENLLEGFRGVIVTTDYVLIELGALMARGDARAVYVGFFEQVRSDPETELVSASADLLNEGLTLFAARPDKEWSLTDCISFALMQKEDIQEALASDHHFEQAGFKLLLEK
jgi:uncharacterized protein